MLQLLSMDISGWMLESAHNIRHQGFSGIAQSMRPVYQKILQQGCHVRPPGTNIYDVDWDLLIVVDACRLDLMKEVGLTYDYVSSIGSIWSVDSTTPYWMEKTFKTEDTHSTTYICGNPFSANILSGENFDLFHEVWKDSWKSPGSVPPRAITDATIEAMNSKRSK